MISSRPTARNSSSTRPSLSPTIAPPGTILIRTPAWVPAAGSAIMARVTAPGGMPVERAPKPVGPMHSRSTLPSNQVRPASISATSSCGGYATLAGRISRTRPGPPGRPQGHDRRRRGLTSLGNEPRSNAAIFDIKGLSYKVKFTGADSPPASRQRAAKRLRRRRSGRGRRASSRSSPRLRSRLKYARLMLGILILICCPLAEAHARPRSNTKA